VTRRIINVDPLWNADSTLEVYILRTYFVQTLMIEKIIDIFIPITIAILLRNSCNDQI